jgi:hypothetical protein
LYFLGLSFRNTAEALSFFTPCKDKSCINLEVDSKVQTTDIKKEEEEYRGKLLYTKR